MSGSWCVACGGPLLGGEHFEGRACGTCMSVTVEQPACSACGAPMIVVLDDYQAPDGYRGPLWGCVADGCELAVA